MVSLPLFWVPPDLLQQRPVPQRKSPNSRQARDATSSTSQGSPPLRSRRPDASTCLRVHRTPKALSGRISCRAYKVTVHVAVASIGHSAVCSGCQRSGGILIVSHDFDVAAGRQEAFLSNETYEWMLQVHGQKARRPSILLCVRVCDEGGQVAVSSVQLAVFAKCIEDPV